MEQVRSSAEEEINEDAASERGGSGPGRLADRKEKLPRSIGEFDFSGQKAAKTRPSWLTPSVVRIHSYPSFSQSHSSSVLAVWRAIGHYISSERYYSSSLFRPAENATFRCASIAASRWDRTCEIEL